MVQTTAPLKVIWFGDHAVRYGHPALAMSINKAISVEFDSGFKKSRIESKFYGGSCDVISDLPLGDETFYFLARDAMKLNQSDSITKPWYRPLQCLTGKFEYTNRVFCDNKYFIKIGCFGDLAFMPKGCGAGSAVGAALSASMYEYFFRNVDKEVVLDDALFFERITHAGKNSGLDATTVVKGGYFSASEGVVKRANRIPKSHVLVVDSGVNSNTEKQIESLENLLDVSKSAKITMEEIGKIAEKGISEFTSDAFGFGVQKKVGRLMYENHRLLSNLELSCTELDDIVDIARKCGAWGAKMTGAGGGGTAIVVGKDLEKIRKSLHAEGYKSFIAFTNFSGIKVRK